MEIEKDRKRMKYSESIEFERKKERYNFEK
jgi:hypothetical protein